MEWKKRARDFGVVFEGELPVSPTDLLQTVNGIVTRLQQDAPEIDALYFRGLQVEHNAGDGVIAIVGNLYRMKSTGETLLGRDTALDFLTSARPQGSCYIRLTYYHSQKDLAESVLFHVFDRLGISSPVDRVVPKSDDERHWKERIQQAEASGNVSQYLKDRGIPKSTYYDWKRKLSKKSGLNPDSKADNQRRK